MLNFVAIRKGINDTPGIGGLALECTKKASFKLKMLLTHAHLRVVALQCKRKGLQQKQLVLVPSFGH